MTRSCTRIFEPLGMRDTAFHTEDVQRLATAYRPTPDGLTVWDAPDGQWARPPRFPDGAAGLLSTVDDLLAFARMLLDDGNPVLAADQVRQMNRDYLTSEQREPRRGTPGRTRLGARNIGGARWAVGRGDRLGRWAGTSFLLHPALRVTWS